MGGIVQSAPWRGVGCRCGRRSLVTRRALGVVALTPSILVTSHLAAYTVVPHARPLPPTLPAVNTIDPPSDRELRFGHGLAASGNYLAATTPTDGDDALEAGIARVYRLRPRGHGGEHAEEIGTFRARNAGDHFGAAVDITQFNHPYEPRPDSGSESASKRLVCLALGIDRAHVEPQTRDARGSSMVEFAGAVEVHCAKFPEESTQPSLPTWTHRATLVSPDPQAGAEFGASLALTDDWGSMWVSCTDEAGVDGSERFDTNPALAAGPFHPKRSSHNAALTAPLALLVGSPRHDCSSVRDLVAEAQPDMQFDAGRVDVFELVPSKTTHDAWTWQHREALVAPTPTMSAWFGRSVAIGHLWIAVGAPGERDDRSTPTTVDDVAGAGAVHLFARTPRGATYVATLRAPQAEHSAWFGWSLALDNTSLAIGCPRARRNGQAVGCVYRFDLNDLTFGPERFDAPEPQEGAAFGLSLDLRNNTLLVGAPGMDVVTAAPNQLHAEFEDLGACWIFERDRRARLLPSTHRPSILFGHACALLMLGSDDELTSLRTYAACGHQYVEEESLAPSPGIDLFVPHGNPPS